MKTGCTVLGCTLAHDIRSGPGNAASPVGMTHSPMWSTCSRWRGRPGLVGGECVVWEVAQALGKPGSCAWQGGDGRGLPEQHDGGEVRRRRLDGGIRGSGSAPMFDGGGLGDLQHRWTKGEVREGSKQRERAQRRGSPGWGGGGFGSGGAGGAPVG
jgi:hypothetical protein